MPILVSLNSSRQLALAALLVFSGSCLAQTVYVPPDFFGDADKGACVLRKNQGQALETDGSKCDALYYYERILGGIYLMSKSQVSFTLASLHHDSITPDTAWRVDMTFDAGRRRTPVSHGNSTAGLSNYYLASISEENVPAYHRAIYTSVWDSIDVHMYHGSSGPRMAFVVRPGGDPTDIQLRFEGQDSIAVDWQGALKIYMGQKWITLEEAMAYQVTGSGVVPLWWSASYELDQGTAVVNFQFETFNPDLPLVFQVGYPPTPSAMGGGGEPDHRNLGWCTYVGAAEGDELESVELDRDGDPYVCGFAEQTFYPVANGVWIHEPWMLDPLSSYSATITKFKHDTKEIYWTTYFGGYDDQTPSDENRTDAYKLAVFNGSATEEGYVFVTGSTNCVDVLTYRNPTSRFALADITPYSGGLKRMWLGAFLTENGQRHWMTTHGELGESRTWNEHGLAIDVDTNGKLVVGGKIETYFDSFTIPDFPTVTPSGAFTRALGDGFFIVFNDDYQIDWSSTFCEFSGAGAYGGVFDMKLLKKNTEPSRGFYMVGSTVDFNSSFDLVPPPSGGYYQTYGGSPSAFIAFVNIDTRQLEYSTRWGGPSEISQNAAFGVTVADKDLWVVGFTTADDLTTDELPQPGSSSGAIWSNTNNSVFPQRSDAFMLRFDISNDVQVLDYGTLVGGTRDDILLDVTWDGADRIYMTGETRSPSGFGPDLNTDYYYQDYQDLVTRDAILLGLNAGPDPTLEWSTYFGGLRSDRGWGVAANETELYLCGTTGSNSGPPFIDNFPVQEFSTLSNEDFFVEFNWGGSTSEWVPWRDFKDAMDYEDVGIDQWVIEPFASYDGFIASFLMQGTVGVPEMNWRPDHGMQLFATADDAVWMVHVPETGPWKLRVFDSAGRIVRTATAQGQSGLISLAAEASGVYLIEAIDAKGTRYASKALRP